ncbi:RluA family pseudouridine synthase [Stigmatella aurantiaca]|uniref:Pseudouridine synthase, RluA family n=1 Tax=Stigmatella aurantiaca (strain DW4/3-1) TaxID=378806 RepID=Q091A2_STIAD|nr:RluA family pseudouridine synthase [Stigmatella aurantiaca]ADO71684.1 Pseudouridine synthase, RluA family [Stigmatella aurantiaca DW4/3-1]EAU66315.1 ribosomal large subunit pseudouridine synthase D [Stigmatella aurantiaca DW4/3-1]
MAFNTGYAYREQLGVRARGQSTLSYLVASYRHSPEPVWRERLARGEVLLDDLPATGEELLKPGQRLVWNRPPWEEKETPRDYTLVYADEAILAVDKPGGLPTMPGGGFLVNTLLHVVRERFPEVSPLHRLGRGTSGLVLFARTHDAAAKLSRAWREHEVEKRYRALSSHVASQDAYDITAPIGEAVHPGRGLLSMALPSGKASRSLARVLQRRAASTLFEVDIQTGRSQQIRIHLAFIGHPLEGDPVYTVGGVPRAEQPGLLGDTGYLLHAERLCFVHPLTGERLELHATLPSELLVK